MKNDVVNNLKPAETYDMELSDLKVALLAVWQVVKWVGLGLLALVAGLVYLIMSIVFSEVNERK